MVWYDKWECLQMSASELTTLQVGDRSWSCNWLSVFGAMQTAQRNAVTKRNPAKRVQNKRSLLAYYFIQSAVAEWKSKWRHCAPIISGKIPASYFFRKSYTYNPTFAYVADSMFWYSMRGMTESTVEGRRYVSRRFVIALRCVAPFALRRLRCAEYRKSCNCL